MKFPKLSQLDSDQTRVFQGSPPDGPLLIMGPPGTGKTVIAFHRAGTLKKLSRSPVVVMFNKVLARYTSERGSVAEGVPVKTLHKWAYGWWRSMKFRGYPPTVDGQGYVHDWDSIGRAVAQLASDGGEETIGWGHLVIDEGQDFPAAMYRVLQVVMTLVDARGTVVAKPGITVLADENQRLEASRNSTIEQIRTSLQLPPERVFCLRKNYRNSLQIATFAAEFYVGLASGRPEPPSRRGPLPIIAKSTAAEQGRFWDACATRIARQVKARPTEEFGVLIPNNNKMRQSFFNRLKTKLDGESLKVQTYASNDEEHTAEALSFDSPGYVTVLNFASTKGLEFDTVFIIDPGQLVVAGSSELATRMALYVACSRARERLELLLPASDNAELILSWVRGDLFKREVL